MTSEESVTGGISPWYSAVIEADLLITIFLGKDVIDSRGGKFKVEVSHGNKEVLT